ncbi:DUF2190 family protein [Serratia sp. JSRIV006]|uniref:DUF2190 family protein n=1 Tax=Serratia sp. JSRIV006 TaxID=2831896 RepID=UPI001CBF2DEB|nr:capsid cement protein [Serratia sp. JSRIV006]UAN65914.1 DUF2190 family protein [Serratia sp. JSRIV006]
MATNYVQDGMTIPVTNAGAEPILSGAPVVVGDLVAVAITDIAPGITGDGFARGVWRLPKLATDDIAQGKKVYLKDGKIQLAATGAVAAGVAWGAAEASSDFVAVRING